MTISGLLLSTLLLIALTWLLFQRPAPRHALLRHSVLVVLCVFTMHQLGNHFTSTQAITLASQNANAGVMSRCNARDQDVRNAVSLIPMLEEATTHSGIAAYATLLMTSAPLPLLTGAMFLHFLLGGFTMLLSGRAPSIWLILYLGNFIWLLSMFLRRSADEKRGQIHCLSPRLAAIGGISAVLLTSALFGLAHLGNWGLNPIAFDSLRQAPALIASNFFFAAMLGILCLRHGLRGLGMAMLIHMLSNGSTLWMHCHGL